MDRGLACCIGPRGACGVWLDFIGYAFQRQVCIGEDLTGFLFKGLELFIFGAEMTDEEPVDACQAGDGGCLGGSAVKASPGLFFEVFEIGGLVIEEVYAGDLFGDAFVKEGIGGIGIRFCFCGRFGDPLVFDDVAVLCKIAFSPFEPVEEGRGHFVLACFFRVDAAEGPYFAEAEAPAGDAVEDRKTADLEF